MRNKNKIGTQEAALTNITHTTVRFSEVDSMCVGWHGEYVRYLEDGREEFGRKYSGIGYLDMYKNGYTAPIVDLQLEYVSPLTVNDVAVVETRYIETVAAKLCFEYIIKRQSDNAVVLRARSMQVFLDKEGNISLNNPTFFEDWKKQWLRRIYT